MASFVGTNKEFRRYIGPRLRNLVQQFTKNYKAAVAACEHCGTKSDLESAHVHGRDRNEIIDLVLEKFTNNGVATVNIEKFEQLFKEEHHPIERSILILCRQCHREYDSRAPIQTNEDFSDAESSAHSMPPTNQNDHLPILLDPPDPHDFKSALLISKHAIIQTTYTDGRVEEKRWNVSRFSMSSNVIGNLRSRPEYRAGNWQNKGVLKVHVTVVKNT